MKWRNSYRGSPRAPSSWPWLAIFLSLALLLSVCVPTANGQSISRPAPASSSLSFLTPSEMAQLLVTRLAERVRQVAELQDSNSGLKLALFDSQTELKETLTSLDASQRASVMAQQAGIDLKADADRQIVELKAERDGEFWRGVWWGGGSVAAIWGIVEFLKWVFGKK